MEERELICTPADQPKRVPVEVAAVISAARPELLKLARPRVMNAEEVEGLYFAMGNLIAEAAEHFQEVETLRRQLAKAALMLDEVNMAITNANNAARIAHNALAPPTRNGDEC